MVHKPSGCGLFELLSQHPTTPDERPVRASAVDARVHYADLKQQPHQPPQPHPPTGRPHDLGRREDQKHQEPLSHQTTKPDARGPDSSGPNSVLDPVPHQREATSNHDSPIQPEGQLDTSVIVDDSTSETPPCASEHSPLVGVRAP